MKSFDLEKIPFSHYGSYMVVSKLKENHKELGNKEGVFLRSIRGGGGNIATGELPVLRFSVNDKYRVLSNPLEVKLLSDKGSCNITFANKSTLIIKGKGEKLKISLKDINIDDKSLDYIYPVFFGNKKNYIINCYKNAARFIVFCQEGNMEGKQIWNGENASDVAIEFRAKNGEIIFGIKEINKELKLCEFKYEYSESICKRNALICDFSKKSVDVSKRYSEAKELATYICWASVVSKSGVLKRDTMYMSKNWMTNVWAWDHCFNAIALSYKNPKLAWDQWMLIFDYQDKSGRLPDFLNDSFVFWNCVKPPIHGFALKKMMDNMVLDIEKIRIAYTKLSKWVKWWFVYRDEKKNGLCCYYHGNDSGWDNSTCFMKSPKMILPDLTTFLLIDISLLADLANMLSLKKEKEYWLKEYDKLKKALFENLFINNLPVARTADTYEIVENQSLLLFMCLLLGDELPDSIRTKTIKALCSNDFFTAYGISTESLNSSNFKKDGYWSGAIWAPSTYLIVEGLKSCKEEKLAKKLAYRFCEMVRKNGFAENFEAETGNGLRDKAYTWTASIFLILNKEYIDD